MRWAPRSGAAIFRIGEERQVARLCGIERGDSFYRRIGGTRDFAWLDQRFDRGRGETEFHGWQTAGSRKRGKQKNPSGNPERF
jgi:hypothetical protein